jgi:hypothetical protein
MNFIATDVTFIDRLMCAQADGVGQCRAVTRGMSCAPCICAGSCVLQAFKSYDEAGNSRRVQCLKYMVLANMLMESKVDPFDAQEAKPYKQDPEVRGTHHTWLCMFTACCAASDPAAAAWANLCAAAVLITAAGRVQPACSSGCSDVR